MFKNLKEKIATQVTKTNQTLLTDFSSPDSASITKDSDTRAPSTTSRDDNLENNRSRLDSASSGIIQSSIGQNASTYVSPSRHYMPPSDLKSEYGEDESDHELNTIMVKMQKLFSSQKNKFDQLKKAYDEVERENEHIKNILQQQQDTSIKRLSELRDQIKRDRQAKEQLEVLHQKEIRKRDNRIEELTLQVNAQKDLPHQTDQIQYLREKNSKLETMLNRCKEVIQTHRQKQVELNKNHDDLLQQLNEKQTFIDSLMKDRQDINQNSDLNLIITNQQMNISHLNEELQQTHDILTNIEQILPSNSSGNLIERIQQLINDSKQQYSDDESSTNSVQLTQTLEKQRQEYFDETEKIRNEYDNHSKQLNEENTQLKLQIETSKKQLFMIEKELEAAVIRSESLNSQINRKQEEIDRLDKSINKQKSKLEV